jgi:hypothetical protein
LHCIALHCIALHCIALQPLHDGTRLAICAPVTGRRHQVCAVRMDAPRARVSPQPEGDGGRKALRGTHGTQGFSAGSRRPRLVQIRAHLAHLCWPIANDTLYGGAEPRASEQRAYARALALQWLREFRVGWRRRPCRCRLTHEERMTLQRVFASEHLYRDWCDKCQYALKPALTDGSATAHADAVLPACTRRCTRVLGCDGGFAVAVAPFLTASGR